MRLLYFDCPTGISGDMCLASLIDLGVDWKAVLKELKKLPVDRIDVKIGKEIRHSITGTAFRVKIHEAHHHRTFNDIKGLINKSTLKSEDKKLSIEIFRAIAEAEGKVHGISPGKVHFHEVGAMDSIIDIVGASVAINSLKADKIFCSPLPLGSGWANTMHGRMPLPAPATVEILKGSPVASSTIPFELTTPTGAAIIKTVAAGFSPLPSMSIEKIGYGAGKKDFKEAANLVRVFIGQTAVKEDAGAKELLMLETNIDDMSPQIAGYLIDRLIKEGALDAYITPVQMKKSRPGILLGVLTEPSLKQKLMDVIYSESTSIGIRAYRVERHCLERRFEKVRTKFGAITVKVSFREGRVFNIQPEYEECRAAAEKKGVPLKLVMDEARLSYSGKKKA